MSHKICLRKIITVIAVSMVIAGCSLAPKYERPSAPVPEYFPGYEYQKEELVSADLGWSDFFKDQRLHALIELALDNNRDLRIAINRAEEARAQYGISRSDRFPTIGLGGSAENTRLPETMRMPNADSVNRTYMAGAALTAFEIDFFGRIKNLSEAAFESYLATEQANRTVHINLVAQVAEAYFKYRAAQDLASLMEKTLLSRTKTFDLVKQRFDEGIESELGLSQAKAQLDSVKSDLTAIKRQEKQALNALVLLVGTSIPENLPKGEQFGKDQLYESLPAGLPSDLLIRRPDIIAAEHRLKAANANIGAARAAFFPNISITGLLGFASPQLGGLFSSDNRYWQYNPTISIPIFGGGQQSNLDLAEARSNIAVAEYEKAIQIAFKEVMDSLSGEETYSAQLDALRELEKSNMKALELAQMRYETGVDSFLQVQNAEVNLYSAQQLFIQTGMESLLNRIELYKALGGGWYKMTQLDKKITS